MANGETSLRPQRGGVNQVGAWPQKVSDKSDWTGQREGPRATAARTLKANMANRSGLCALAPGVPGAGIQDQTQKVGKLPLEKGTVCLSPLAVRPQSCGALIQRGSSSSQDSPGQAQRAGRGQA